jgi:2-keto-4-pentenoate hydratase/2-oxohepta-3-ene-1,7-dioic acid hydratase in catechol pathway
VKAVRYRNASGEFRIGRLEDESIVDAGPAGEQGFVPTRAAWTALAQAEGETIPVASVTLAHPVVPRKLICIGLNYRDHAEESELDLPEVPVIFAKWTTSLIGQGETIVIPREETRPDYEGELAVVIGRRARDVPADEAMDVIEGVTCAHDVSSRDHQFTTGQWVWSKSFDTFCPLGPVLVTPDELDLDHLDIETRVSGEVLQSSNTDQLVFSVPELIAHLSRGLTLEPGDVILTGTPGGVGMARNPQRWLEDGDVVEITIGGIGTLRNRVIRR